MSKNEKKSEAPESQLTITRQKGESERQALARHLLTPSSQAAESARHIMHASYGETGLNELVDHVEQLTAEASRGSLKSTEGILIAQLHTLDLLFNRLVQQSVRNMGTYTESAISYMKLALRAQAQSRSTAESLADLKLPKATVRQTNIAHGHQQVNNYSDGEKPPNELLEDKDG